MKRFTFIICFLFLILLFIMAVPVSAATISTISPDVGYKDGKTKTYTITGTNFSSSEGDVWLERSGKSIDATIKSWDEDTIVCTMKFYSTTATGDWKLIVKGSDNVEVVKQDAFTIMDAMTLTKITPSSAQIDDDDVDFTLAGKGLSDVTDVYLHNDDYDDIYADLDDVYSDEITGTFDLTDAEEDTYDVCVVDTSDTEECDLSFKITTDAVGSIDISSSPSGASIYVDSSSKGTTPDIVDNLAEGSYKVVLKKTGYNDWGKIVKVTAGDTSTVDAVLEVMAASSTTVPTTAPTTVRTTKKSTLQVPTAWPSDIPSTAASPVDPALVIGAAGIGIGLVALWRR